MAPPTLLNWNIRGQVFTFDRAAGGEPVPANPAVQRHLYLAFNRRHERHKAILIEGDAYLELATAGLESFSPE